MLPSNLAAPQHFVQVPLRRVHDFSVNPGRVALVVVDMQNLFVEPGQALAGPYAPGVVGAINSLAATIRAVGGRVAWTRHTVVIDGPRATPPWFQAAMGPQIAVAMASLQPGSRSHALYEGLVVSSEDIVVDKFRMSAFSNQSCDLDQRLRAESIDSVIVAGTVTNFCCQSTAREALMLDYRAGLVCDATAAASDEHHNSALTDLNYMNFFDLRPTAQLIDELNGLQSRPTR
jgi:ureidoacrylate peracid hydrolase